MYRHELLTIILLTYLTGMTSGEIAVFDQFGTELSTLRVHSGPVCALLLAGPQPVVLSLGEDRVFRVFDPRVSAFRQSVCAVLVLASNQFALFI